MTYSQILTEYKDVLRPEDVQEILQIGRNTIYNYLSKGIIRSHKIAGKYRIPKLYLLEYMYPDTNFNDVEETFNVTDRIKKGELSDV